MIDRYLRNINYMRLSITDRCNLHCSYCRPIQAEQEAKPCRSIMKYEEILEVAAAAAEIGITAIKVTGGEPLARPGCCSFIRKLKLIPGIQKVTITTNGTLLTSCLSELKAAGIDGINISLDTLKPEVFYQITGLPWHQRVIKGIQEAVDTGIPTKINTLLQKGMNDEEWIDLVHLAKHLPIDVRFIEMMPIGYGRLHKPVNNLDLIHSLYKMYPDIKKDDSIHGQGPAVYYHIPGFLGSIGFISPIHEKFCGSCNRIRLESTGKIKPCLCYAASFDVMPIFCRTDDPHAKAASEEKDAERQRQDRHRLLVAMLREAVNAKPEANCFDQPFNVTETKGMSEIGG